VNRASGRSQAEQLTLVRTRQDPAVGVTGTVDDQIDTREREVGEGSEEPHGALSDRAAANLDLAAAGVADDRILGEDAATASGSWAFHAAYVASFTSTARAR
jgi:hypothetical protein